jgi:hypothetical protein
MGKGWPVCLLIFLSQCVFAQHDFFIFRHKNKNLVIFMQGSYIAFQVNDHQWYAGYIKRIQNDSFYIRPLEIIYYPMHADTLATDLVGFTLADVYAMPKDGVEIHWKDGDYSINMSAGHVHWYWVKSGWIFRVVGAGYAGLTVVNGLIQNDLTISGSKLGIAAAVFALGVILKIHYKPIWRMGKKYYLEYIRVP